MSIQDRNTVFYCIYPLSDSTTSLDELRLQYLEFLSPHLDIIWNAECFTLTPVSHPSHPHLKGQVWFDSSLEDEWYVVWLLRKLTAQFPGIVSKVWDDDGEFMLIEASDAVPPWLIPEISDNRVFLYRGKVAIVPQPTTPAHMGLFPMTGVTLDQALRCIHHINLEEESARIDKLVCERLSDFPKRSLHKCRVHLPVPLIHALSQNPGLISSIISMYLYADRQEITSVVKHKRLLWVDTCDANITLTRCQYAQLYSQRISSTPAWPSKPAGHVDHLARQLGLKVTLGAELALSVAEGETGTDAEFVRYRKKLEGMGYFRGDMEGSATYKEQLRKAELFYKSSQEHETSGNVWMSNSRALSHLVDSAAAVDLDQYRRAEVSESDPDGWMDVMPLDIQRWFLRGREHDKSTSTGSNKAPSNPNKGPANSTDKVDEISTRNMDVINNRLQSFVEQVSSHEGAEVPGDLNLNPDDFFSALQGLKDQVDRAREKEDESDSEDTSSIESDLRAESEEEMREYMRELEGQLGKTTLTESFEKGQDGELDIDFNLVSNILNSFSADSGLDGPASSVLASLGVRLPRNEDNF
eukprot:sb/3463334/